MRMTEDMLSFITRRLKMRMVAIAVAALAVVMLLAWGFAEALDEEIYSHSAEYWKGVEEHEN